jgi:hypothetical protein
VRGDLDAPPAEDYARLRERLKAVQTEHHIPDQWSGQKSGGDSAVSSEFLIAGMIFHPSRVKG